MVLDSTKDWPTYDYNTGERELRQMGRNQKRGWPDLYLVGKIQRPRLILSKLGQCQS